MEVYSPRKVTNADSAGPDLQSETFFSKEFQLATIALIIAVSAVPLWLGTPSFFIDWPNHLSRVFIENELLSGAKFWGTYYEPPHFRVPNEALDLSILALMRAGFSLDTSAKIFLSFGLLSFVGGFCFLARAQGTFDLTKPLLATVLFFAGPLMFGLVDYVVGVGFALTAVGLWLSSRNSIGHIVVAALGVPLLFFCHIVAAALFVVCINILAIHNLLQSKQAARRTAINASVIGIMIAAVLGCLYLALSTASEQASPYSGSTIHYSGSGPLGALIWKITIFPKSVFDGAGIEGAMFLVVAACALALLAILTGKAQWRTPSLVLALSVAVLAILLPERIANGSLLDYRVAYFAICVAGSALPFLWPSKLGASVAFALYAAVATARVYTVAEENLANSSLTWQFDQFVKRLPAEHSTLLIVPGRDMHLVTWSEYWHQPVKFLAARAVLNEVFVPSVYGAANQQPISLKPQYDDWGRGLRPYGDRHAFEVSARSNCLRVHDQQKDAGVYLYVFDISPTLPPTFKSLPTVARTDKYVIVQLC